MILVVLDGAHISRLLHLIVSLIMSKMTYQHPQIKAHFTLRRMNLHIWGMIGIQLVKY